MMTWTSEGQKVYVAAQRRDGTTVYVLCVAVCAAGTQARVVNEACRIDWWKDVCDLIEETDPRIAVDTVTLQ